MAFNPFGAKTYTLRSSISSIATTIPLTSFKEPVSGVAYTMALLNTDIAYATIQPKTASSEFISFTGITQYSDGTADLTGVTRGLQKKSPFTPYSTFQLPHSGQSQLIISDSPQLFKKYGALANDEVITGQWTAPDPLSAQGLVTRDYMLNLINGGTISTNRVVVAGTAGETIAAGNLVYLKLADGFWWKADADLIATLDNVQLGIAQGSGTASNAITGGVLLSGVDTNNTGTAGAYGYASNTAGVIATSAGTNTFIVGQYIPSLGGFYFNPEVYQLPTIGENAALAGSQGVVGPSNKYITQDNVTAGGTDQSQTTQNGVSALGEADTTGLHNYLAQSFIPTVTKIRGVNLYKTADTGTFTGTVTISIQADTAGSPSGTPLATVTLTNTQYSLFPVGEFEAIFASEYAGMVVGSLYWIVIQTSTSDTSNHPNLGVNTAGGYASGSAKYKNTTDGWVAISTIDLYFKTIVGTASQVVKTNTSGKIENTFYDVSELPIPAFTQNIGGSPSITATQELAFGSNSTGSVFYAHIDGTGNISRWERDALTGSYFETHSVNPTITIPSTDTGAIIVIGIYMYFFSNDNTNIICSRFLAADLTGETVMTVPTVPCAAVTTAWTDGVYAYVISSSSDTVSRKWSVSGTTFSAVSTATCVVQLNGNRCSSMSDGTNVYLCTQSNSPSPTIYKLADINGSAIASTTIKYIPALSDVTCSGLIFNVDSTRMYIGVFYAIYDETAQTSTGLCLIPISKP